MFNRFNLGALWKLPQEQVEFKSALLLISSRFVSSRCSASWEKLNCFAWCGCKSRCQARWFTLAKSFRMRARDVITLKRPLLFSLSLCGTSFFYLNKHVLSNKHTLKHAPVRKCQTTCNKHWPITLQNVKVAISL